MEKMWSGLILKAIGFAPKFAVGLAIFLGFWIAGFISQKIIERLGKKSDPGKKDVFKLLGRMAKVAVLVFGVITALGTMGLNVSALVAGLGLTGFALGFALRDAISNLLAGVLILIYRPFRVNDRIAVAGFEGVVAEFDLRYTTLDGEGRRFLIPNSKLFTNTVTVLQPKP